jgi:hypothetical protein
MANAEHLELLEQGVESWNDWRRAHERERIDLSGVNLRGVCLNGANFFTVNLSEADLSGVQLMLSDLRLSNLNAANFVNANLANANLANADLRGADLSGANLSSANLYGADLRGANLSHAILDFAILINAALTQANLTEVRLLKGAASFGDVDLSDVIGLETIIHGGPSTIGTDTLYKSRGHIPDKFLRAAGLPEEAIDFVRSIRAGPAIQWHSCFISFSTKDDEFVRLLHSRMREANMRVWFAPQDLHAGKKLHEQLFEAIQISDRLLLVLSEHSIQSEWVMTEIRKTLETEKKEKRRKLFPIRLCDFETLRDWTCFDADTDKDLAVEVREYFIPDFSNWKDHDAFESAFARLQKDLQEETKIRSK